jgi:LPS export ABC transporter protein LptC
MPKSIYVYLLALFFLIGSILFLSSFFLNSTTNKFGKDNSEIIFEANNISINLNFKESDLQLNLKSSMVNSLKEEKNLYVYQPRINLEGKEKSMLLTSEKGKIAYDKNTIYLESNIKINGTVHTKKIEGISGPVEIDLDKRNLSSDKINIFLEDYEISFNEVIFNEEEMIFKGNPIFLIDKNGLKTITSLVKLKSNGELIFPNKMNTE